MRSGTTLTAGLASAEVYDPSTGRFTPTAGAPTAAHSWGVAEPLPGGRVLIAGGFPAGGAATKATDIYDPATDALTAGPPLGTARAETVAAVVAGGRVLVAGGTDAGDQSLASAETLSAPRAGAAAAMLADGDVLVAGGVFNASGGTVASAERYVAEKVPARRGPCSSRGSGHRAARQVTGDVAADDLLVRPPQR